MDGDRQLRHILRYLLFPDFFERITVLHDKQYILNAIGKIPLSDVEEWDDIKIDQALLELRRRLIIERGSEKFDFYDSDLKNKWDEASGSRGAPSLKGETMDKEFREQITREDILEAIAALERGEPHTFGPSTFYDLLENGRRYPPKAVVGLAARRTLGRPLRPDEFSGGQESWAFGLLRDRGFTIVNKQQRADGPELPSVPPVRVWIEDTKTAAHGHGGPGWEFGSCLWSPSAYEGGSDHYALMREPQIDDLVIHINNGDLVGWSYVSAPFRELKEAPPSPGQWAGRPSYYRIDLKGYQEFPRSIPLNEFVDKNRAAIQEELKKDAPKRYPFILYGEKEEVRHAQGAYLTRCTQKLFGSIRTTVFGGIPRTSPREDAQYWTMALGEGGRLWDECQEKGIAAIGWDEFELGDLTKYPDRESIQQILIERRGTPGPTPSNDALCLFQFSHEMAVGDYIVAKVGRRRLLGVGLVTSDYFLDEARSEYKHCRRVKWLSSHGVELPEALTLGTKTLTNVTTYEDFVAFVRDQYFESHVSPPPSPAAPYSIERALETLFMPRSLLENILAALWRKKNVILQGPPGVGKTFAARHIAFALLGELDHSRVEMVQFHQSYAYEDFVQGWRPKPEGGFRLKNGVFVEFCNRARIDSARKYVFIIDEINRGNLSKILGELMMLIEADKRGAKNAIPLTYSESDGERFSVPENVYLLGLMNTADRSLALVDYALRRRFVFFSLTPALDSEKFAAQLISAGGSPALVETIRRVIGVRSTSRSWLMVT
jgi:MoxR-like ATPase